MELCVPCLFGQGDKRKTPPAQCLPLADGWCKSSLPLAAVSVTWPEQGCANCRHLPGKATLALPASPEDTDPGMQRCATATTAFCSQHRQCNSSVCRQLGKASRAMSTSGLGLGSAIAAVHHSLALHRASSHSLSRIASTMQQPTPEQVQWPMGSWLTVSWPWPSD